MDLRKVSDEEKVRLCRKYFIGGFALLPFLWIINFIWFFREAFYREDYEGRSRIRKDVIRSGIGALIWIVGTIVWIVMYQTRRASWGYVGDQLSFLIPLGEA